MLSIVFTYKGIDPCETKIQMNENTGVNIQIRVIWNQH